MEGAMQILITRRKDETRRVELVSLVPGTTVVMSVDRFLTFCNLIKEARLRLDDPLPDEYDYVRLVQMYLVDHVTVTHENFKAGERIE